MKEIFKSIQDRLAAQVAAIRWTDFDLGQLDQQPQPPVSFPCALVGFTGGQYAPNGEGAVNGTVHIEVVLAFRLRERTHSVAESAWKDEALEHLDTVEAARAALQGLSAATFTGLEYLGFSNDRRADLRVWRLRFQCQHWPAPPTEVFVPWPGPQPVDFCVHPDI